MIWFKILSHMYLKQKFKQFSVCVHFVETEAEVTNTSTAVVLRCPFFLLFPLFSIHLFLWGGGGLGIHPYVYFTKFSAHMEASWVRVGDKDLTAI